MVSIDEELEAAEAAKRTIDTLSITSAPGDASIRILRKAKDVATRAQISSAALLNDARRAVGIALSDLIRALQEGTPTEEKIDKAEDAIEAWINRLRAEA
jgi:hypothetical protein